MPLIGAERFEQPPRGALNAASRRQPGRYSSAPARESTRPRRLVASSTAGDTANRRPLLIAGLPDNGPFASELALCR